MKETIVFIHDDSWRKGSIRLPFNEDEAQHVLIENETALLESLIKFSKVNCVIYISDIKYKNSLFSFNATLGKVLFIDRTGKYSSLHQKESSDRSRKIKKGIELARKNGHDIGAPTGNQNRKDKLKEYDKQQLKEIFHLIEAGLTYREIVDLASFKISISKITYIRKRFDVNYSSAS